MNIDLSQPDPDAQPGVPDPDGPNQSDSYPSVYLQHPQLHKLPKKGTMKVKYHVKSRTSHERNGKTTHSADIALHSLDIPKSAKKMSMAAPKPDMDSLDSMP